VGDYPVELWGSYAALRQQMERLLLRTRQDMLVKFGERTVALAQEAQTPTEALQLMQRHLQSLQQLEQGTKDMHFPFDTLKAQVLRLQKLQKEMDKAQNTLKK